MEQRDCWVCSQRMRHRNHTAQVGRGRAPPPMVLCGHLAQQAAQPHVEVLPADQPLKPVNLHGGEAVMLACWVGLGRGRQRLWAGGLRSCGLDACRPGQASMSAAPRLACCESLNRMRVGSLCMLKWSATSGLFSVSTCAARKHRGAAVSANLAAGLTARFGDAGCMQRWLVGLQAPQVFRRREKDAACAGQGQVVHPSVSPASSLPSQTQLCRGARARWP